MISIITIKIIFAYLFNIFKIFVFLPIFIFFMYFLCILVLKFLEILTLSLFIFTQKVLSKLRIIYRLCEGICGILGRTVN